MRNQRTHHVITDDGVTIGGTVHGQGPPLVFLQGVVGDGDIDWIRVVGHLTDRFTCHLPSLRGRGLSGDHPDLSVDRVVADFVTYVDSLRQPAGLVGWSGGGSWAINVAARSDAVNAVAPFEAGVLSVADEQEKAALGDAVARTAALAADGRFTDAVRAFLGWPFDDEELALAEDVGYCEAAGRYVTSVLNHLQQVMESGDPTGDPAVLGAISAPVMVLLGSDTKPFFAVSAQHVANHVPNARIQEIPGVAHAAPLTHPEALAEAVTAFFAPAEQPS